MGNCCGSASAADDYQHGQAAYGRPQKPRVHTTGPGHTLGGSSDAGATMDASAAAALAAEVCVLFAFYSLS